MSALLICLVCLGSTFAYLLIGFVIMKLSMPAIYRRALVSNQEWKVGSELHHKWVRESANAWGYLTLFFWPIVSLLLIVGAESERHDPILSAKKEKELRSRISQLEDELGIGDQS